MSRIIETENVTLISEAVAPRTVINWNPLDNSGAVTFDVQRMESVDGVFQRLVDEAPLSVLLADIAARTVTVGETEVTFAHVDGYIRGVFDQLYNERAALLAAAPEDDGDEESGDEGEGDA